MIDLKRKREAKHLSQERLAAMVGVQRQSLSAIECGRTLPSVENAKKLAKILGFDWSEFYDEEKDKRSCEVSQ